MRILLFHKGGIGDVVFALPLIADLRRAHPDAELCALTHDEGRDVLSLCPALGRVFSYGPLSSRASVRQALGALEGHFDVALTTVRSPRAGWLLWQTGARTRVGFGTGLERLFFTHRAPGDFEVVFSRRFQRLGAALGIPAGEERAPLQVPVFEQQAARARLEGHGWDGRRPLTSIHVGGGWPTKRLPDAQVTALARRLSDGGSQVLLIGGGDDRGRAQALAAASGAITTAGNSVREALAELSLCQGSVGLDSGLSHASVALGVPTVLLFGPNDPRSILPAPNQRILSLGLACQPCNRRGKTGCPLGHHGCMTKLSADQVFDTLARLRTASAA